MNTSAIFAKLKIARTLGERAKLVRAKSAKHGSAAQREKVLNLADMVGITMDTILDKHVSRYVFSTNNAVREAAVKRILKEKNSR